MRKTQKTANHGFCLLPTRDMEDDRNTAPVNRNAGEVIQPLGNVLWRAFSGLGCITVGSIDRPTEVKSVEGD